MPGAVAGWIIGAVGATGVGAALIQAGVALAFNAVIAKITAPKGPKPKDLQNEIRQSDAPRVRYVGRNRASGAVLYWDWHQVGSRRVLFKLIAVAQGGMTTVHRWWLNDVEVTVSDEAVVGNVGGAETPKYGGIVSLRWRKGRDDIPDGGLYNSMIVSVPQWTMDHRATGVGTVLGEFKSVDSEDVTDTYSGGDPTVMVEFDGDVVAHPTLPAAHATNLARQLYDILIHPEYGWLRKADLDLPSWEQAIVDCNDPIPTAGGVIPRYVGGGGYQLAEPLKDVAQRWLDAMDGKLFTTTEGKLGLRVGKWRAPRYTITEDKIVSWDGGSGRDGLDMVTTLVPKFTSPAHGYQETTADPWEDATALARYGEVAPKELDLPVCQDYRQARRLAKRRLAELNPRFRFTINLRFWGLLLLEEESVWLDFPRIGVNRHACRIVRYSVDLAGGDHVVTVVLESMRQAADDWTAAEEGAAPVADVSSQDGPPPAPVVAISTEMITGRGQPYARVTFQQPAGESVIGQYRPTGSTAPWTEMVREGTSGGVLRTQALFDGQPIDIRLGIRKAGWSTQIRGEWTVISNIDVVADPTGPDAPEVVSYSGSIGAGFSAVFRPDLGVNYARTELFRSPPGQPFTAAVSINSSYSTSTEVTIGGGLVPAGGGTYWLRSENGSGVKSPAVQITTIT